MGATRTFRFQNHHLQPDPVSEPVLYGWECKTAGCGAKSEASEDPAKGSEWSADHLKANPDHKAFREVITRAYRYEPGEWQ